MKSKLVVAVAVLAGLCFAVANPAQIKAPASLAVGGAVIPTNAFYVSVKGAKQSAFKAEVKAPPPLTGTIEGIKFSYQESMSVGTTGLATGRRQYSPITFTKVWGPSSPEFATALTNNENLLTVTFEFSHQKITLTNAHVSSIRRYIGVPMANEAPDTRELEDISITFQKIEMDDQAGATTTDDWSSTI
jgi:type VI secretion system secreted protein Hcp